MDKLKLKNIIAKNTASGCICLQSFHFINFDLVEHATGESWESLRKKVFDTTQNFLEKRLSQEDLIIKLQDGFLVVFAHINKEGGHVFGEQLSDEINRFFIGNEAFQNLQVQSKSSNVKVGELDQKIADIKKEANATHKENTQTSHFKAPYWQTEIIDKLNYIYRPIWDSGNEVISSNSCIPQLNKNGASYYGREVMSGDKSLTLLRNIDLLMLRHSQKIAANIALKKKHCVITVTVSYKTLSDRTSRVKYFDQLASIPKQMRKFFFVCVDQIPSGAPQGKLIEIFRPLNTLCGATLVHNLPSSIHFDSFLACGVTIFGFSMQEFVNQERGITADSLDKISFYCSNVQKLKAVAYVTDVNNLDFIQPFMDCGVRFFCGVNIGQSSTLPMLPSTLQAKNIFCP